MILKFSSRMFPHFNCALILNFCDSSPLLYTNPIHTPLRNHSSVCFTMPTRDGATLIPTGSVSSMTGSTGAPEAAGAGGGVIAAPSSHDLYRLLNNRFRLSMKQQQKAVYWSCGIQLVRWCSAVCCCCWGEGAPRGNKKCCVVLRCQVLSFIALIVVAAGGGSGAATAQNITTTVVTFILAIVGLYG